MKLKEDKICYTLKNELWKLSSNLSKFLTSFDKIMTSFRFYLFLASCFPELPFIKYENDGSTHRNPGPRSLDLIFWFFFNFYFERFFNMIFCDEIMFIILSIRIESSTLLKYFIRWEGYPIYMLSPKPFPSWCGTMDGFNTSPHE